MTLVASFSVFAELVKAPQTIKKEKGSIAVTEKGKSRWTADWTMEPLTVDGRAAVRFTEKGRGLYSPYKTEVQWTVEAIWKADGHYRPLRFERTFTDSRGKSLATRRKTFDEAKGVAMVDDKAFTIPPDTITVEGMGGILRSMPFESSRPFTTHVLSNEPRLYEASIEPRGRERLKTPAGEFDCYKVEMVPHLGALDVIRKFLPKTQFWFTVAAPHFWVKYEGFENGVGTPRITMELKTYER